MALLGASEQALLHPYRMCCSGSVLRSRRPRFGLRSCPEAAPFHCRCSQARIWVFANAHAPAAFVRGTILQSSRYGGAGLGLILSERANAIRRDIVLRRPPEERRRSGALNPDKGRERPEFAPDLGLAWYEGNVLYVILTATVTPWSPPAGLHAEVCSDPTRRSLLSYGF